jgi:hypothetical protein
MLDFSHLCIKLLSTSANAFEPFDNIPERLKFVPAILSACSVYNCYVLIIEITSMFFTCVKYKSYIPAGKVIPLITPAPDSILSYRLQLIPKQP